MGKLLKRTLSGLVFVSVLIFSILYSKITFIGLFFILMMFCLYEFKKMISLKSMFPYIIGLAFGFGWTPCIGPILGSILALASIEETLSRALLLLSFYSLGLAIPFVLSGYLIQKFLIFSKNFKRNIKNVL